MKENEFQALLIKELRSRGWGVMKNDPNYISGFPDLTVYLPNNHFMVLEVKRSANAPHRPGQDYWINELNGLFVYPENMDAVLYLIEERVKNYGNI